MFNNRMLAVAAVLVMAVPALGAATPIVVPPVPEQLVEGHTVFTVIEIARVTTTTQTRFAAAVAVLVREYQANARAQRFPGVLWFNDQYLVNPTQSAAANDWYRYPCGGAVIAVNAGDPDPRVAIARVDSQSTGLQRSVGTTNQTYANDGTWVKPAPGTYYYGQDSGGPGDAPTDYAWVGVKEDLVANQDAQVYSDTTAGALAGDLDGALLNATPPWDYRESYLITDPNDHSWVIDKYNFMTRDRVSATDGVQSNTLDNTNTKLSSDPGDFDGDGFGESEHFPTATFGGELGTLYEYPVWVVNVLGSPVFIPDNGNAGVIVSGQSVGENCLPFKDLLEETLAPANGAACGASLDNGNLVGTGQDTDVTLNAYNGLAPWTDDPCMGYMEPSRNGYCYGGQGAADADLDGDVDKDDCMAERDSKPLRQYNALLYFKLQDLRVAGANRDHSDPVNSGDTNGCAEEQYWWGPNPPQAADQWPCPGDDDDNEGNSHSFHPSAPVHEEREACLPQFAGPNPTNHGGSSYITPGARASDAGWYGYTPCDYLHATRNIDIYFSPGGRPFSPIVRFFDVMDLEGSSAPFQDFHSAYPGVSP